MPIKTYRPTTPSRRFATSVSRADITKDRPEKSLVESKSRTGGRNSTGRVTSRFIGGGAKKAYRGIDFKRDKSGIEALPYLLDQLQESLLVLLEIAELLPVAGSPPGSSRRAAGYSPVLRLTADEVSLPLFPCPQKFTFWDTTLLPRGTFFGSGPPVRSRTPQGRFPPARLLHPGGRCGMVGGTPRT